MGNASIYFSTCVLIAAAPLMLPLAASATCWDEVGCGYGIDPSLLKTIVRKESRGWAGVAGPKLKDGNRALGLIQINTIHLPNLARFGIRRRHLFDACTSQKMGAWVLADCIQRFGATWKSMGCYYAGPTSTNVSVQVEYVYDVQRFYEGYCRQQAHQISTSPARVVSFQED